MVVGCYAGTEDVSFGYFTSHETSSADSNSGGFLVCRTQTSTKRTLFQTLVDMEAQVENALQHRTCSIAEIQQFPEFDGKPLFNSVLQIEHGHRLPEDRPLTFGQGMINDESIAVRILYANLYHLGDVTT